MPCVVVCCHHVSAVRSTHPTSQWVQGQNQAGLPQLLLHLLQRLCLLLCACPPSYLQEGQVYICVNQADLLR